MPMYCNNFELEESRDDFLLRAEPPEAFALYPSSNPGPPGPPGPAGPGVAEGGTTGQLLAKASDEDYDTEWIDPPELDAGHVTYDDTETYEDGTVGKAVSDLNSAISTIQINKADVIVSSASGAIASFSDGMAAPIKDITVNIEPIQSGSGDPSPTNVRPISGHTGATVRRSDGNNLADYANATQNKYLRPEDTYGNSTISSVLPSIAVAPNSSYILNMGNYDSNERLIGLYDSNRNFVSTISYSSVPYTFTIPSNIHFIRPTIVKSAADVTVEAGTTYPITFPSAAGTVYGGTLALRMDGDGVWSGELTADHACISLTDAWSQAGNGAFYLDDKASNGTGGTANEKASVWCNMYPQGYCGGATSVAVDHPKTLCTQTLRGVRFIVYDTSFASVTDFNTYVASNPIQIVYELATPLVYTLTPEQVGAVITTLYGDNNVWADTGEVSMDYRADTKLYIERLTAPTEDDLIANAPIASGKFFMIGNTLYLSTAAIASGAQITIGTNAVKLSLADALNQINS